MTEDDVLPKKICESCHIGVAATVDLIDRMVAGQHQLRKLYHKCLKQKPCSVSKQKDIADKDETIPSSYSVQSVNLIQHDQSTLENKDMKLSENSEKLISVSILTLSFF